MLIRKRYDSKRMFALLLTLYIYLSLNVIFIGTRLTLNILNSIQSYNWILFIKYKDFERGQVKLNRYITTINQGIDSIFRLH